MVVYEPALLQWEPTDPWQHASGEPPSYRPEYDLLARLLTIPVQSALVSESGVFPKGIDLWLSTELRRAGFSDAETWPRLTRPRVFPREVALLIDSLPTRLPALPGLNLREEVRRRAMATPSVTPTDAKILGRAYDKQVDVCISRWDRGPEVLVSTKAQLSSFGKNLPNRFEEAYGDAANLRARYPLAATGYFFVQRSTILDTEPEAFERAKDMMRKLRAEGDGPGYTATGMAIVEWDDAAPQRSVAVRLDVVPEDLRPSQFLERIVTQVLRVTPVSHHVEARSLVERRTLPVQEEPGSGDGDGDGQFALDRPSDCAQPGGEALPT